LLGPSGPVTGIGREIKQIWYVSDINWYMYDMDVGCSLKGSTASTIAYWNHSHTYIIYDFSQLSQIWGNLCGGNGMNVLPYAHPQLFKVFKHLIYV
jgi:hypothetical protein